MKNEQAVVEIILKGQQPNATLKDLERSARALRAQLSRLPTDSKEFADKSAELKKVNDRLASIRNDIKGTGGMFQWLGKELKAFGLIAVAALGFQWLTGKVQNIIQGNAQLSDSLADVRKTTGMTEAEASRLNKTLSQMDTRTATKELRQIAVAAGQLGIAKNDVLKFTQATDKMVVSLADEFTGGAEEVTKVFGGLRDIFKDVKSDRIDEDMLKIGNAVNVLASQGRATGPVVTDFANRIGGVAVNLGWTSAQVLGTSAALQELNVGTEKGGTAIVKILQRMTTHVSEFAEVAGMKTQDFADLVNHDLFGAFTKVLEGSQKSGQSATALGVILDNLGVDGAGASEVVTKLGSNMGLLKDKVSVAGQALQNTDSIMAEFALKNNTLGAEMDRLGKGLASAFTNTAVSNGLKSVIGWLANVFDKSKKVSESMEEERVKVNALMIEIDTANLTNKRRLEIYEELKSINPDIVAGIDQESLSVEKLTKNVEKFNEVQIKKIALQGKQEKIDEANKDAADKLTALTERQLIAYESLAKVQELNGPVATKAKQIIDNEKLSLLQKTEAIYKMAYAEEWARDKNGKLNRSPENRKIMDLIGDTRQLANAEREYHDALNKSADLTHDKLKMAEQFGPLEEQQLDFSKKTNDELKEYIKIYKDSKGTVFQKEAAAATEELMRRVNEAAKNTKWVDPEAAKKAKKLAEEIRKEFESLRDKLMEMDFENSIFNKTDYGKDIAKVQRKLQQQLDEINNNRYLKQKGHEEERAKMVQIVEQNATNELIDINRKYYGKEEQELKDHLKKQQELLSSDRINERNKVIEEFDAEIAYNKAHNKDIIDLAIKKQEALNAIDAKYATQTDPNTKKQIDHKAAYADFYDSVAKMSSAYFQLLQQQQQKETESADRKYTADVEREKRLLDSKQISQEQYNDRIYALDKEKQNRERTARMEAYQRDKDASTYNAILNGIEAVTRIWAKWADAPWVAGALTAVQVGLTAAQLSMISSTPVPQYAKGGLVEPSGFVSQETMFQSASGQPFIAGEAGTEYIIPNWMVQNPVIAEQISNLESIRRSGRTFADGGSTGNNSVGSGSANWYAILKANTNAMNRLNDHLDKGIPAHLNYDTFTKNLKSIDDSRSRSKVG